MGKEDELQRLEPEQELSQYLIYENMVSAMGKIIRYQPPQSKDNENDKLLIEWIRLLPIENDQEEFDAVTENLLFSIQQFWKNLIVNNQEMRSRILFSLLFYLSQFKQTCTSYELIMDHSVDISDSFPTNIPVLSKQSINKIKQLKQNEYLIKIKAFEQVMDRLEPQEIQNIQYVVNNY